jgi:dihydropteroate synthase
MLPLAAGTRAPVILMHMQGTPQTMQANPQYQDVVAEVCDYLLARTAAAVNAGVPVEHVLIDPGIGFGKTVYHNLELLRRTNVLVGTGQPVVIGTSRKGFIGRITGIAQPERRQFGTAATVAWAVANGAAVVRVHDVGEMAQVVAMTRAICDPASEPQ